MYGLGKSRLVFVAMGKPRRFTTRCVRPFCGRALVSLWLYGNTVWPCVQVALLAQFVSVFIYIHNYSAFSCRIRCDFRYFWQFFINRKFFKNYSSPQNACVSRLLTIICENIDKYQTKKRFLDMIYCFLHLCNDSEQIKPFLNKFSAISAYIFFLP